MKHEQPLVDNNKRPVGMVLLKFVLVIWSIVLVLITLYKILEPKTTNHLVLMNYSDDNVFDNLKLQFTPEDPKHDGEFWEDATFSYGASKNQLVVHHYPRQFRTGILKLINKAGKIVVQQEISPQGRWGRTLVVWYKEDGSSGHAWNAFPEKEK